MRISASQFTPHLREAVTSMLHGSGRQAPGSPTAQPTGKPRGSGIPPFPGANALSRQLVDFFRLATGTRHTLSNDAPARGAFTHPGDNFGLLQGAYGLEKEIRKWLDRFLSMPGTPSATIFNGPQAWQSAFPGAWSAMWHEPWQLAGMPAQHILHKSIQDAFRMFEQLQNGWAFSPAYAFGEAHANAPGNNVGNEIGHAGRQAGNVQWESRNDALMERTGKRIGSLSLHKADAGSGNFGKVAIFTTQDKARIAAKVMKHAPQTSFAPVRDELKLELDAFNRMYRKAGSHPNIVNVYGIAKVPMNGRMERALLMDAIPGPNGADFFRVLRQAWKSGRISSEEYWSAVQQCGRDMLDAVQHLAKAGVLHNDIKPENCIIDRTGKLVVVDFGCASALGSPDIAGDMRYTSFDKNRDVRSDVYSVGSSMVSAVEGFFRHVVSPNSGRMRTLRPIDGAIRGVVYRPHGNHLKQVQSNRIESAWSEFADRLLQPDKHRRVGPRRARQLDFLNDSMLDKKASQAVIRKVLRMADEENAKPPEARWKTARPGGATSPERKEGNIQDLKAMRRTPSLALLEKLRHNSKTDAALARRLKDNGIAEGARTQLEQEARARAEILLEWKGLAPVDELVHVLPANNRHGASELTRAREIWSRLEKTVSADELERYAGLAERLLLQADALPDGVHDRDTASKLNMLRATLGPVKEMVRLDRLLAASGEETMPRPGSVRERARKLETGPSMQSHLDAIRRMQAGEN